MTAAQSIEQKARALVIANDARAQRARLRDRLHRLGRRGAPLEAARVLSDEHERYARMEIGEFLLLVPGIGKAAANRMLLRANHAWAVNPWREIGALSDEQRVGLVAELQRFVKPRPQ